MGLVDTGDPAEGILRAVQEKTQDVAVSAPAQDVAIITPVQSVSEKNQELSEPSGKKE